MLSACVIALIQSRGEPWEGRLWEVLEKVIRRKIVGSDAGGDREAGRILGGIIRERKQKRPKGHFLTV